MHAKRRERILNRAISYIRIFGHKRKEIGESIAKELEELKANRFDADVREWSAISIAEKYEGKTTQSKKLSKLGEELIEFIEAVLVKDELEILDEAGDMLFLILHILYKRIKKNPINLTNLVVFASEKMDKRSRTKTT